MAIDYSKWDSLECSDTESETEYHKANQQRSAATRDSDSDGEYSNEDIQRYLQSAGVESSFHPANSSSSHGNAEEKTRGIENTFQAAVEQIQSNPETKQQYDTATEEERIDMVMNVMQTMASDRLASANPNLDTSWIAPMSFAWYTKAETQQTTTRRPASKMVPHAPERHFGSLTMVATFLIQILNFHVAL